MRIFFSIALFFSVTASAHYGHDALAPVKPTDLQPSGEWGSTRGGYGYVGPSEAEAYWLMGLECNPESNLGCEDAGSWAQISRMLSNFGQGYLNAVFLDQVKENAYEYLALQLAAVEPAPRKKFPPPACLRQNESVRGLFAKLPTSVPSDEAIKNMSREEALLMNKFRAVDGTLTSGNMIRSLVYHDHLKAAQAEKCGKGEDIPLCNDLSNQLRRMRDSVPVLFWGKPQEAEKRTGDLRRALHRMLGARHGHSSSEAREAQGQIVYDAFFSNVFLASAGINLEKTLAERMDEARAPRAENPAELNAALTSAFTDLNHTVQGLKDSFANEVRRSSGEICRLGLAELTEIAPNIVRQAIMDLPVSQRLLVKELFCQSGLLERVQIQPQCQGFSKSETPEEAIYKIDQRRSHFPYGANVAYSLKEKKGEVPKPKVEIDIYVNSDLSAAELDKILSGWSAKTSAWYNCQSGAANAVNIEGFDHLKSCPPSSMPKPALEFQVNFKPAPEGSKQQPLIQLTRCVRSELAADKRADCAAAREFRLNQCLDTYLLRQKTGGAKADSRYGKDIDLIFAGRKSDGGSSEGSGQPVGAGENVPGFMTENEEQLKARCEKDIPPAGDPRNNRANAAHYTLDIKDGTLFHEVGHLLGLADEYKDPTYPFSPLGEHDSIMNNSNSSSSNLYARHIDQILAIKTCDARNSAGAQ